MDPKTLASLDPKLRETYERVMGATAGNTPPSPATPATDIAPQATNTDPNAFNNAPIVNQETHAVDQLPTTNPFAAPPFEAIDTNPAFSAVPSVSQEANTPPENTTLNPDGLSSAFPTTQTTDTNQLQTNPPPDNQPLPTVGSNTVDMTSFNLNPMGQKTDQISIPSENTSPPVSPTPVVPFTPQEEVSAPVAPAPSSFATTNIDQAKPVSATIRIIYIFAGVIFFLIYTFFWLKIFKFPLPF